MILSGLFLRRASGIHQIDMMLPGFDSNALSLPDVQHRNVQLPRQTNQENSHQAYGCCKPEARTELFARHSQSDQSDYVHGQCLPGRISGVQDAARKRRCKPAQLLIAGKNTFDDGAEKALGKLQAVGEGSQPGDQLQSDQARQQDSHQRNDCQIQQHRPRTPFIKMNQQKRQHRHGNAQTGKDIFAEEAAGTGDGNPNKVPAGNSIGDSIGDSQRACCVLPAILQNRNHYRNPDHCRKRKLKACIQNPLRLGHKQKQRRNSKGGWQIRRAFQQSRRQKQQKHDKGAPGRNPHSGQLRVCDQNQGGNSGAQNSREPHFFQKSEQSCADQGQVQAGNRQQVADSCALIQRFYFAVHSFFQSEHHGGCSRTVLFAQQLPEQCIRFIAQLRKKFFQPSIGFCLSGNFCFSQRKQAVFSPIIGCRVEFSRIRCLQKWRHFAENPNIAACLWQRFAFLQIAQHTRVFPEYFLNFIGL